MSTIAASVSSKSKTKIPLPRPSVTKQCVGVDVSKDTLVVCFSQMDNGQSIACKATKKFANRPGGYKAMENWMSRLSDGQAPLWIVMEATGVYHENLAYHLSLNGYHISVQLPNKTRRYIQSLNIKTKTDAVEARCLAQMGLERKLKAWSGASPVMLTIKRLCREREALQEHIVAASNQLHAYRHAHLADDRTLARCKSHIKFLEQQIQQIEAQLTKMLEQDGQLKQRVENVCTIKGVGLLTALSVIAETNGFELIENKAQLVSYAGYDVVQQESGSTVRGKTRISKRGNSHIRRALHYPALSASRFDPKLSELYQRITERNPKTKMVGMVAVQRKLLILIYTLYKTNKPYDPNFEAKK